MPMTSNEWWWGTYQDEVRKAGLRGLAANIHRQPLTALEFVRELRGLLRAGYTEERLAKALSKPPGWVRLWIGIARLPDSLVARIGGPA